jgi:acetylornithine aminotransferase
LVLDALEAGLLINVTAERVIRLLPPLILSIEEAQQIVERLVPLVERFVARH